MFKYFYKINRFLSDDRSEENTLLLDMQTRDIIGLVCLALLKLYQKKCLCAIYELA